MEWKLKKKKPSGDLQHFIFEVDLNKNMQK